MLQYIEIDKKSIPVNYGIRVMVSAADALGLTFDGLCKKMNVENPSIADMFGIIIKASVIALNEGARIEGLSDRYSEDSVVDMIDEHPELLEKFSNLMMGAMHAKDTGFTMAGTRKQAAPAASEK